MLKPFSSDDACEFRGLLRECNYTDKDLVYLFGSIIPPPLHHEDHANLLSMASQATPQHCLATLFFLGQSYDKTIASTVLPDRLLEMCIASHLLVQSNETLTPHAVLVPVGELFLAADTHGAVSREDGHYVPTLNQPALHLGSYAIRRPAKRTLDLCGGFAFHGMIASEFSDTVVTTDLNPRSKEFAEFNASLNDCSNLTALTGDMFAPVSGQTFDLILCNPPFVISPSVSATFRENPMELDGFVQQMIANAPDYMSDDGYFQTVCEWAEFDGEDWKDRIRKWTDGNGCDVWVIHANRQLPMSYAQGRVREMTDDGESLETGYALWDQYFTDRKVTAIHGGLIFMRRRDGENWFDTTQIAQSVDQPISDSILSGFASRDVAFASVSDSGQTLLNSFVSVTEGLHQDRQSTWSNHQWEHESITLRIDHGVPVTIGVDANIAAMIESFDGQKSVADTLEVFGERLGLSKESAERQGIPMVRQLLRSGILSLVNV